MSDEELSTMVTMRFPTRTLVDLVNYLEYHEGDIAWGINDFDELRSVFELVMGRESRKGADDS